MKGLLRFVSKCSYHNDCSFLLKTQLIIYYHFCKKVHVFPWLVQGELPFESEGQWYQSKITFFNEVINFARNFFLSDLAQVVQIWVKITQG